MLCGDSVKHGSCIFVVCRLRCMYDSVKADKDLRKMGGSTQGQTGENFYCYPFDAFVSWFVWAKEWSDQDD